MYFELIVKLAIKMEYFSEFLIWSLRKVASKVSLYISVITYKILYQSRAGANADSMVLSMGVEGLYYVKYGRRNRISINPAILKAMSVSYPKTS